MPTRPALRWIATAAVILVTASAASVSWAQRPAPDDAALLKDFIHYTRIARYDQAKENAQALLDRKIKPTDFVKLVDSLDESTRRGFADMVLRAERVSDLEAAAGGLLKAYEQGKLDTARDPQEISRSISMLTGTQRQRLYARERLIFAGEYALPQLLPALIQRNDGALQGQVRDLLVEMSRQAIVPLVTALPSLDPAAQELVVGVLGDIPYRTSLPFLYELLGSTQSDPVRRACQRSIQKIAGVVNVQIPLTERFVELGNQYYVQSRSLISFPDESYQLLWSYDPGLGLIATAIDTNVFTEAMVMRLAERALRHDPANGEALSLWLAANFSREIHTPQGYDNPAYGKDRREAMYYAVAAGAVPTERVLARALDGRDTPLARRAIAAIERTAGGSGLWGGGDSRRPLLEAIRYPNRRVQYEAALAVGAAQPRQEFAGSDRVVPILASAIRDASARYALVVATENQPGLLKLLQSKGYIVLPPAKSLSEVEQAIAEAPGVDLIVTELPEAPMADLITTARGRPDLAATPILALASLKAYPELSSKFAQDPSVRIAREGLSPDQIAAAADQLIQEAAGGAITEDEARQYKARSLAVLRDLAVSGNAALKVSDAAPPLIGALSANTGQMRLDIAEVLSYVGSEAAQRALMDAALKAEGGDRVAMLNKVAESAKRAGNMLDSRQVKELVKLARTGSDDQATAAAACMGALNLPNADLIPLILGESKEAH